MSGFVWKKWIAPEKESEWVARLDFVESSRVVVTTDFRRRKIAVSVYSLSLIELKTIAANLGGSVSPVPPTPVEKRAPLLVRQRLVIVADAKAAASASRNFPGRKLLIIPATVAFGTGAHATTATCLRLLCDAARARQNWALLDIGSGTGILAAAGELLGASKILGVDFDPKAVRIARENLAANNLSRCRFECRDILAWKPAQRWDIVAANLYSEVLIRAAETIARATAPGGQLIFSGVLREQEKASVAALRIFFRIEKVILRGKWCTGLATRIAGGDGK